MQYRDKTYDGYNRDTSSIETRNIMDKPEAHAILREDTWWINQRNMQYLDKTHSGKTKDTCSIETRHKLDKPEAKAVLGQDTKWTNQRKH